MNTIYLLDALFLLLAGMAALFAFGVATSRFTGAYKAIFFLFMALFLFTLLLGYVSQPREPSEHPQARMEGEGR
jgi:uncharacterized membrane protein YtjA (UPF0391 family)